MKKVLLGLKCFRHVNFQRRKEERERKAVGAIVLRLEKKRKPSKEGTQGLAKYNLGL